MSGPDITPTDDELRAFDRGELPEDQIDAIASWLEAHPEAEERLRRVTELHSDYAVEALRRPSALENELHCQEELVSRVVKRVLQGVDAVVAVPEQIRDYQLVRPLGQGGMGSVYLARHKRLQRDVALKLLRGNLAAHPEYRARFEREMAVVGQLDHPNLVRAYDAGVEGPHLFLVMELLEGQDLARLVEHGGPLAPAEACEVIRQAALGLHHAHEHGLVHRDVKPGNLFLTTSGVVKVIDLGLARVTDTSIQVEKRTTLQTVMGSPDWMAPEQFERSAVDRRADIYSLGCTLFHLLTGRPPFVPQGEHTYSKLVIAHQMQPPPCLKDFCPQAPAALGSLLERMLAKRPDDRPVTALEIAETLAPFAAGHKLTAPPTTGQVRRSGNSTPLYHTAPPTTAIRKRTLRHWVVLTGALAVVLALLLAWRLFPRTSAPTDPSAPAAPAAQAPNTHDLTPVVLQPSHTLQGHDAGVLSVAFSPNGKWLASGSKDRTIRLWNTRTWKSRPPLKGHRGDVIALAFAPENPVLASATNANDECMVRLWDVDNNRQAKKWGDQWFGIYGLAFSPDGKTLACGGWDKGVIFWNVATETDRPFQRDIAPRYVRGLSFSPDGKLLATGGNGPTRLWDIETGKEVPSDLPADMCPTFVPGSNELAGWIYSPGRVAICAIPSGKVRRMWLAHPQAIEGLAVSPDGRFLASVGAEGLAYIWATADASKVATLIGHKGSVYAAAFSPDGTLLATTGLEDRTVRIWELPPVCHVSK